MSSLADIPVVIFCGGRGARFDAETQERPKPLIEVAGSPLLRHIIDGFYRQGFRDFILPCGYLGDQIFDFKMKAWKERWFPDATVIVEDTGVDTHVGGRLWQIRSLLGAGKFVMTYGDGLSDVSMPDVIAKHEKTAQGIWCGEERPDDPKPALLTITAVRPASRFGSVQISDLYGFDPWGVGVVHSFEEKPPNSWINGGFMVVEPRFIHSYLAPDYLTGEIPYLEADAMRECAADGFMRGYKHMGYWRCMDTRRDREQIEDDVRRNDGYLPWLKEG